MTRWARFSSFGHSGRALASSWRGGLSWYKPPAMTNSRKVLGRRWLGGVALIFLAACGRTDGSAERALPANEWLEFDGTWTAAGTRETLQLGPDRRAAIFHLMGSL